MLRWLIYILGGMRLARRSRETIREEGVNVLLNQSLRGNGLSAKAERRRRNAVPDIQVTLKTGDLVLLECKWDDSATALESQLDERLTQFPDALGVVGVLYPERLTCAGGCTVRAATACRTFGIAAAPLPNSPISCARCRWSSKALTVW